MIELSLPSVLNPTTDTIAKSSCSLCTKEFNSDDLSRCSHCEGLICEGCSGRCLCDPRTKFLRVAGSRGLFALTLMEEMIELNAAALIKPLKKAQIQRLKMIKATIDKTKVFFNLCAKLAA